MSHCKDCGAEIDWMHTEEGRYIPVDPEPVFVIEGDGDERFYAEEEGVLTGRPAMPEEVQTCQRQFEIVRKRRRNFVVFRRKGG